LADEPGRKDSGVKLRQLQCFCTLVDCNFNVSRAAEALHATQPAISKQLRRFEEDLGLELFRKNGVKFVGLTRAGDEVLRWSRSAMQAVRNIGQVASDARAVGHGAITIATTHTHARYVLLDALARFRARFPLVRLHLLQGTPELVMQMVWDGRADFGVTASPQNRLETVAAIPFLEVPQVLVLPPEHPLAAERELTLEKIAAFPLIAQNVERPSGAKLRATFQEAGVPVNYAVEALDADVMKSYVQAGLGIAIVPGVACDPARENGLEFRALDTLFEPMQSTVLLRRNAHPGRACRDFLEQLSPRLDRHGIDAALAPAAS
jgi:DNA-binding transcriptional LysR family regulator